MFHDRYDIPVKAADHERVGESEEVYELSDLHLRSG